MVRLASVDGEVVEQHPLKESSSLLLRIEVLVQHDLLLLRLCDDNVRVVFLLFLPDQVDDRVDVVDLVFRLNDILA